MDEKPLKIDGRDYAVPALDTFNMDEWEILYEKTGLTLDTIEDAPFSPGLLRTLLIVAYRRGNPDAKAKQVEQIVGKINFLDAVSALGDVEEADDGPPAQAASLPPPSETSSQGSSDPVSGSGSGTLAVLPQPTGTPLSATLHTSSQAVSGS